MLEACPSLNQYAYAMSPFKQSRDKRKWWALIRAGVGFLEVPRATRKRKLTIERHSPRGLDPDNLIGGAKRCIIDNLKAFRLIVDDSDKWIVLEARNVPLLKSESKPYTMLYLEDL